MSTTYTVEEAADLTGHPAERLREAIATGDLALAQTAGSKGERVTRVELERWWRSVERSGAPLPKKEDDA